MKSGLWILTLLTCLAQAQGINPGAEMFKFKIPMGHGSRSDDNPSHRISTDLVEEAPSWPQQLRPGAKLSLPGFWLSSDDLQGLCVERGQVMDFPKTPNGPDLTRVRAPRCCFTVESDPEANTKKNKFVHDYKKVAPSDITLGELLGDGDRPDSGFYWRGALAEMPVYSIKKGPAGVSFLGFSCFTPFLSIMNDQPQKSFRPTNGEEIRKALSAQ